MAKNSPTKPEASEKVLTEKLMGELKASGADLSKLTQQPAPEIPPEPPAPSPMPTPESSAAPPPNEKWVHLPHLKFPSFKKTAPPTEGTKPEPSPVPPEVQQLTNEALMETIEKRLAKINNDDIVTLRLNKKELLAAAGLILAAIWLKPAISSFDIKQLSLLVPKSAPAPSPSPLASPIPSPTPISIRLRMGANSIESASAVKALLAPINASVIDIVYDQTVNSQQTLVITRQDQLSLREHLTSLLSQEYVIASEAATLTEDSSFTATILIGKNSKITR